MSLPFYPFYWADYISKTYHLSQGEHGVYMLLMCYIYNSGKSIPSKQCYSIAKAMNEQERSNVDAVLAAFFILEGDFYVNTTALEVIAEANARHEKRSHAGRKGGNARVAKASSKAQAMLEPGLSNYNHNHIKKKERTEPAISMAQKLAALKEPDSLMDFASYAQEHGIRCDVMLELERFTQYCLCGKGRYTNHKAAFRNWLLKRKETRHEPHFNGANPGARPSKSERFKQALIDDTNAELDAAPRPGGRESVG